MTDATSRRLNAGVRTFHNIARAWELSDVEQSQVLGRALIEAAFNAQSVSHAELEDAIMRLSVLLGIYAALESLLPGRSAEWLRSPNGARPFCGRTGLDLMRSDRMADVINVRQYLDSQLT